MKYSGFILIIFGLTNIIFPDIIAYVIGWLSVFFWVSILLWSNIGPKKDYGEKYVKIWDYKIFR